jgi:SET domain-containing protein
MRFTASKSRIHGLGVFTRAPISLGTIIDPDTIPDSVLCRTGFNHSCAPTLTRFRGNLKATRDILAGEELTLEYPLPFRFFACKCGACNGEKPCIDKLRLSL